MLKIAFRKINPVIVGRLDFNLAACYVSENHNDALRGFRFLLKQTFKVTVPKSLISDDLTEFIRIHVHTHICELLLYHLKG